MGKLIDMSNLIKRSEFQALQARVEFLEDAIDKLIALSEEEHYEEEGGFVEDDIMPSKTASQYAEQAGIFLACSVDPIDIFSDPTSDIIGKEFSLIECPKAAIPTDKRIPFDGKPLFDFSSADELFAYALAHNMDYKDGPYIDFSAPKHQASLTYNQLTTWIRERLDREGLSNPEYINIASNFLNSYGKIIPNPLFKTIGFYGGILNICDIISDFSESSGIGLTFNVDDFCTKRRPKQLIGAYNVTKNLVESGCPLQFISFEFNINTDERIDPNIVRHNLEYIKEIDVPEIHVSNFLVKIGETNFEDTGVGVYADFLQAISDDNALSVFSIASPRTLPGYGQSLFDQKMHRTPTYEAARRGFWKMTI